MTRCIKKAIQKKGFALIEAVSQCPVQYGKASKMGGAVDMLKYFKKNSVRLDKAKAMSAEQLAGKITVGEFIDIEKPELADGIAEIKRQQMEAV